jgi:NADP-dependent 3-hydroxy acid dehydrogenase YdfG
MSGLNLRVVLITGAGAGLGRTLAVALARAGAVVLAVARSAEQLASLEAEASAFGGRVVALVGDVRDTAEMARLVQRATSAHGPIDILVNNAAVMHLAPMVESEVSDWLDMVDTNLKGPLALIGAALPGMLERGRGQIVNISSICARKVGPGVTVYGATKTALDVVSEGLRQELASKGISVTSFQLGAVDTALNDKIRNPAMRRLIRTRAGAYTPLAVDQVAHEILHVLSLPRGVTMGQVFLAPADQAN